MGTIRVGTTSWSEKTLVESGRFYPHEVNTPEERLRYYASRFSVVEADSTYYGLLTEHNAQLWAQRAPEGFVFHIKAFRLFTQHQTPPEALPPDIRNRGGVPHKKNFYYRDLPEDVLDTMWTRFRLALEPLRATGKLGAVLFQYPPWFVCKGDNRAHVAACADRLHDDLVAVEFRHASWFSERHANETLDFERERRLVHVIADAPQGLPSSYPPVWAVTNPALALVRLHGRNARTWERATRTAAERFDYLYSDKELAEFVAPVRRLAHEATAVHVLFNNCHEDRAQRNAQSLRGMLGV